MKFLQFLKTLSQSRLFYLRKISGRSMLPTLVSDKIVLFLPLRQPDNLKIGDVVLFRHEGLDKIKRVHKICGGRFFCLGDNALHSIDSRHFGWLDVSCIRARTVRGVFKFGARQDANLY